MGCQKYQTYNCIDHLNRSILDWIHQMDFVLVYILPEGKSRILPQQGNGQSSLTWTWNEKRLENSLHLLHGDLRSITVLHRGSYPIAEKSPNNLLKSHLITVHLYRFCCIWSFCHRSDLCVSSCRWTTNVPQRNRSEMARGKLQPHSAIHAGLL